MTLILSGSNGVSDVDGTAATPAIRGTDANTGIFFPAADTIAFAEGGVESMRLDSSGNLGLGVTPSAWGAGWKALEVGPNAASAFIMGGGDDSIFGNSCRTTNGSAWYYTYTGVAPSKFRQQSGRFEWYTAPSGTAGNAISFTQAMTLDASGRLGIATTSPSYRLSLGGDIGRKLAVYDVSGTASGLGVDLSGSSYELSFWTGTTAGGLGQFTWGQVNTTSGAFSEKMRLDSSGNLLVGTTSAAANTALLLEKAAGYFTVASNVGPGGPLNPGRTYGISLSWNRSNGDGESNIVWGTSLGGNPALTFATWSGTTYTERARITSGGALLVGTTSNPINTTRIAAVAGATEYAATFVNETSGWQTVTFWNKATSGTIYLAEFGTGSTYGARGSITYNGTTLAYNTSSDYRLKENIQPMTGALAKVAALKPCTYNWKADGSAGEGFIAHELAEVVPGCVTGEKDAVDENGNPKYQGIDTSFLVATLTAALQEQQAIIQALTERVAALEAK